LVQSRRKNIIQDIIQNAYYIRDKNIKQLYYYLKLVHNQYVDKLSPRVTLGGDNENLFKSSYGQEQFHLQAKDTLIEQLTKNFYNLNNTEQIGSLNKSLPNTKLNMINNNEFDFRSLPNSPKNEVVVPLKVRQCDDSCSIPEKWGQRIYETLSYFRPSMNYKKTQFNICEFEKCQLCYDGQGWCNLGVNCTDNFKFIKNISRHYQGVRTMIR
jgi:hypothetical protein